MPIFRNISRYSVHINFCLVSNIVSDIETKKVTRGLILGREFVPEPSSFAVKSLGLGVRELKIQSLGFGVREQKKL